MTCLFSTILSTLLWSVLPSSMMNSFTVLCLCLPYVTVQQADRYQIETRASSSTVTDEPCVVSQ